MEGRPLILEPFQIDYLLDTNHFKITNKTRQAGGSVQLAAAKFYKAYTLQNYRCDIVSVSLKEAADKILKIKAFWETLPKRYKMPLEIDNALSIGFHKGKSKVSIINSQAASSGIRGGRKDLVFDEFAHIRGADELLRAATPAIMNGDLGIDIVSTPAGRHNMFGEIWLNEVNAKGEKPWDMFSRHEFIWLDVGRFVTDYDAVQHKWRAPVEDGGYAKDWRRMDELVDEFGSDKLKVIRNMYSWDYFLQEFCGVFHDDTFALFPYELLDRAFKPPVEMIDDQREDQWVEPWNEFQGRPENNHNYLILGVDFGKSGETTDKTSIQILERDGDLLKHRYSKNLSRNDCPDFPAQAAEVARLAQVFGVDKIMADEGGLGLGVVPIIRRMLPTVNVEGFEFTAKIKAEMVMNVKSLLERDKLWLMQEDHELYHEIHGMQGDQLPSGNIRYHGEPHDDMFWALALAAKEGAYKHFAMYTIDSLIKELGQ